MPGKNKHLTYDERVYIQQNLNKLSFKDIGKKLGNDCTSISRKVRRHTQLLSTLDHEGMSTTSAVKGTAARHRDSMAQNPVRGRTAADVACAAGQTVRTTSRRCASSWRSCKSQLKRDNMDCGQNPRLFLKEEKGFGKVHKEEKQKAIDLYIRYCKQGTMVLWNLGILISGTHWSAGTGDMKWKVE